MKSSTICGRKTITEPTPAIRRVGQEVGQQAGRERRVHAARGPADAGVDRVHRGHRPGEDQLEEDHHHAARRAASPPAGAARRGRSPRWCGWAPAGGVRALASTDAAQPARSSRRLRRQQVRAAPGSRGARAAGAARRARGRGAPPRRAPESPSARSRQARSSTPPRACSSSVMVSTRQVGTPRRSTWAIISSERSSVQASATSSSASGAGPSSPAITRPTTASSGLIGVRL